MDFAVHPTEQINFAFAFLPFIGPIISGLAGLFGGKKSSNTATSQVDETTTNTPILSGQQQQLSDVFLKGLIDRFNQTQDLSGYSAGGLQTINEASSARQKIINNLLASRGLSFSPAATTANLMGENARLGESVNFLNQIPLLQRQLQGDALGDLMKGFSILPTATTSTRKGTTTGTQPSSATGGLLSGIGAGLYAPYNAKGGSVLNTILGKWFK